MDRIKYLVINLSDRSIVENFGVIDDDSDCNLIEWEGCRRSKLKKKHTIVHSDWPEINGVVFSTFRLERVWVYGWKAIITGPYVDGRYTDCTRKPGEIAASILWGKKGIFVDDEFYSIPDGYRLEPVNEPTI